ncbi:ABC transporter substrate-binding protein [Desertimonas flava]|uniref:ABC transporter substrate-binding protein n=1 Tax=Desertimonas flava TaxID=2064846 RepID=UPI000E343EF1|nr:ABC transporter substrate-binding protein [Desertimonas flava]
MSRKIPRSAAILALGAALAVGLTTTAGSAGARSVASAEGGAGELVIAEAAEQPSLDPHKNVQYLSDEMHALYDTLVVLLPDGTVGPNLAESWTVDGQSITFTLRQDVAFHDGTPFDAEAVKYNLDRIVDPATESTNAKAVLGPYESAEVVDEFTVTVTWSEPFGGAFMALANANLSIVSPTAAEAGGFAEHPVGTGPYRFVEYTIGEELILEANPDYTSIRTDLENHGRPAYDRVVFRYVDNESTRANLLTAGEVDIAQLAGPEAQRLSAGGDLNVDIFPSISEHWVVLNATVITDPAVREAIFAAIDRDGIRAAVAGDLGQPNRSALPTLMPGYDPTVADVQPEFSVETAGELLDAAGYELNGDGVRERDGETISFEILTATGDPWVPIAELVQDQLRQVGIETTIKAEEFATVTQTRRAGEQGIYVGRYGINEPASQMLILFSCDTIPSADNPQGTNLTFNCNEELDAVLNEASQELDAEVRNGLLSEAQHLLAADFTSITLYESQIGVFSSQDIAGIGMQPDGILKINDVHPADD